MKLSLLLFTVFQIASASQIINLDIHLKDDCNSNGYQLANKIEDCGYSDESVSNQDLYKCLCDKNEFWTSWEKCDCVPTKKNTFSSAVCEVAEISSLPTDEQRSAILGFGDSAASATESASTTSSDSHSSSKPKSSTAGGVYLKTFGIGSAFALALNLI